jgi:hypothetical protein
MSRRHVAAALAVALVFVAAPALADDFVPVGGLPAYMLVDHAHDQIYVTDWGASQLRVLDATGSPVDTVPLDGAARQMDLDGDTLYVSLPGDNSIAMIDVTTNSLDGYIDFQPVSAEEPGWVVSAGGRVWYSRRQSGQVMKSVSPTDASDIVEYVPLTDDFGWDPQLYGFDSDPNLLLTVAWPAGVEGERLYLYDVTGGDPTLLASHHARTGADTMRDVQGIAISPDGTRVYYSYSDADGASGIAELDATDLTEVDTYPAPSFPGFGPIAVSPNGGHIAAAEGLSNPARVSVFAHGAASSIRDFTIGPSCLGSGVHEEGLAFTQAGDQLVALVSQEQSLVTFLEDATIAGTGSSLTLSSPSTAAPGDALTISGDLDVEQGSAQGRAVEIWSGVAPNASLVDTLTTGVGGAFSTGDVAELGINAHCYTARYEGDAVNSSSSAMAGTEVARHASSVTVGTPSPTTVAPTDAVTVAGQVTVADSADQAGRELEVREVSLTGGGSTVLETIVAGAGGAFTFVGHPEQEGEFRYLFLATQTDRYQEGFGNSGSFTVSKSPSGATITPLNGNIVYGRSATVRVHIPADTDNPNIVLSEKVAGQAKTVIYSGPVDVDGNYSLVRSPKTNATYELAWAGDDRYESELMTGKVWVHAIVRGELKRAVRQQGPYKLYRKGSFAYFPVAVIPYHGSKLIEINLYKNPSGSWRKIASVEFHLRDSRLLVLVNTKVLRVGLNYRIQAVFSDSDHAVGKSPFRYFRVIP